MNVDKGSNHKDVYVQQHLDLARNPEHTLLKCTTRIEYTRSQGYEPRLQGPLCPMSDPLQSARMGTSKAMSSIQGTTDSSFI